MTRKATAKWQGGLKNGRGTISSSSGVLANTPYSFGTRFEQSPGTNPEELVAAAHAGCFSMALSAQLEKAGVTADTIDTTCIITLEKKDTGFEITESHLEVTARIASGDSGKFEAAANEAKAGCPISRLLNTKITMNARLAGLGARG